MILEYLVEKFVKVSNFLFRPRKHYVISIKQMQQAYTETYGEDKKIDIYSSQTIHTLDKVLAAIIASILPVIYLKILSKIGLFQAPADFLMLITFLTSYVIAIYSYQYLLFLRQKMYE